MADQDASFVKSLTDHQLPLMIYIRSLMPGDPEASDVAQQTNAKIWEKKGDFEAGTQFRAWAFAIARYEVLNHRKRQARDSKLRFSDELESLIAADPLLPEGPLMDAQDSLQGCLGKMREKDRNLLLHRYASTGTLAEYAAQTDRSLNSLKVSLHRLRNKLADCIRRQLSGEEEPA